MQQAIGAYQRGALGEAERLARTALALKPDYFEAAYLLGIIAGQSGRTHEASEFFACAVSINPGHADASYNLGVALGGLERHADALEAYERATVLRPDYADAHYNRGVTLAALNRPGEALASYERAIALKADYPEAHNNRGIVLDRLHRPGEALASYDRAVELRPDYASALNNRGVTLLHLGRYTEALASHERAIALNPDYADAYNNLGNVLSDLGRYEEALVNFERAIWLKPDYADAYYHRGNALRELHRHREAVESYERAIALQPDHASAHWNLADCRLLLGDFARGWEEYEWRWKLRPEEGQRSFPQPLWLGAEPLAGRTILLHGEMGLGDTLLFCRYAGKVAALGAKVILEVQPALLPLLGGLEGVSGAVSRGAELPPFDCHCPLMSLPLAFKTEPDDIPAAIPYIRADPARVAGWRSRLGEPEKPRVGLVWSGSTALKNDRRSMALADMLPLVGPGFEWVSLQKEVRDSDSALLASHPEIRRVGEEFRDFADTAAVIELLDLVVTVDTSAANLAGAMGKNVWILLPFNPHDWRWMLEREDSLWYPTARLFRQSAVGDWAGIIDRVAAELARRHSH
ncbi:MAG TPA: tetratricopeptide repeat-containing glycosyltransferase family protein [Casimicrobiaceae bacterium]